jgi:hypothetical protein|tara:strand:- start:345 stop:599 length:255 start_codon:yes stop_codon:yes gene_type:complete
MWINFKHLKQAQQSANKPTAGYFWHFFLAMGEVWFLLLMCIGSLIHAVFPWALDFKLLQWRIERLKKLKEQLPNNSQLKKIHFD